MDLNQKALQLLEGKLMEHLCDQVRERYIHQWSACSDPDTREKLWFAHSIVGDFEMEVRALAQEAKEDGS